MYYLILSFCLSCFPSLTTNDPAPLTPTAKPWLRVTRRLSRDYKYVLKASYEKVYVYLRRIRENVHIGSCWQKCGWKILKSSNPQSLGSSLRIGPQAVVASPLCSRGKCNFLQHNDLVNVLHRRVLQLKRARTPRRRDPSEPRWTMAWRHSS